MYSNSAHRHGQTERQIETDWHTHRHIHKHTHTYLHTHTHANTHIHIRKHTHTHIYRQTDTHTYTHTTCSHNTYLTSWALLLPAGTSQWLPLCVAQSHQSWPCGHTKKRTMIETKLEHNRAPLQTTNSPKPHPLIITLQYTHRNQTVWIYFFISHALMISKHKLNNCFLELILFGRITRGIGI